MKTLRELLTEYSDATCFVLQERGGGKGQCVYLDSEFSNREEILLEYGDIELKPLSKKHISEEGIECSFGSDWIALGDGDNPYTIRIFF